MGNGNKGLGVEIFFWGGNLSTGDETAGRWRRCASSRSFEPLLESRRDLVKGEWRQSGGKRTFPAQQGAADMRQNWQRKNHAFVSR